MAPAADADLTLVGRSPGADAPPPAAGPGEPSPIRVLALIDHLALGGAESLLAHLAELAPAAGLALQVGALAVVGGNPLSDRLRRAGVEPVVLEAPQRLGPRLLQAVRRHISAQAPDIVHTHLGTSDLVGSLAARSLGIPVVSTIHNPVHGLRSYARQVGTGPAARALVRAHLTVAARRAACARIIAVSEFARREYLRRGWARAEQIVTLHNGFELTPAPGRGRALRAELGIDGASHVIVMVGALRPEKGHRLAIAAMTHVLERFPDAHLLIAGGGGTEREAILRAAAPLEGRVRLLGMREEVMPLLDAADLCLHPSLIDLFPGVVIEAMAASTPVLATAVGGIPEQIVDGESGVLLPAPTTPQQLGEAIIALLADPARRRALGVAGRARYEARFRGRVWARQLHDLYARVIRESGRVA